jgi:polysaccharide pyruvyl transferase WcaK-like protein
VGFFGWGNFGDELFVRTYKQYLGDRFELEVVHDLLAQPYFSQPIDSVVDRYDAFIIGGGDLLIPWQLSGLYWRSEYLAKPVLIVGVGVPTWGGHKPDVVAQLRTFVSHPNVKQIWARDIESRRWIEQHLHPSGEVTHAPDLVCALDLPVAQRRTDPPLLGVVTRFRRGHDVEDYSKLKELCDRAQSYGYGIRQIVLGTMSTGEKDLAIARQLRIDGKELIHSDDLDVLCRSIGECSMLASMKFHGHVVAAMYGVPSIVLSPTDKSRNFMRRLQRTDLLSSLEDACLRDHFSPFPAMISTHTRQGLRRLAQRTLEAVALELDNLA